MRPGRAILGLAALAAAVLSTFAAGAHTQSGARCEENKIENKVPHRHTAAGSCKDTDDWSIVCATQGNIGPNPNNIRLYVTQTTNGAEVEGCSQGDASTRGRLVVAVDTANGARASLDSDSSNPNGGDGAYINAQAYRGDANCPPQGTACTPSKLRSGVWCSADEGEASSTGDGYARSWTNPGVEGGLDPTDGNFPNESSPYECRPGFLPIP